jgi:hypothetical protein
LIRRSKEQAQKIGVEENLLVKKCRSSSKKFLLIGANAIPRFKNQISKFWRTPGFLDMRFVRKGTVASQKSARFAWTEP